MAEFTNVLKTSDLSPGEMKQVEVGGTEVVVANVGGRFCAIAAFCSHEQAPLVEGELDGEILTCPWHFTEFDLATGEAVEGVTDKSIAVYEVRVEGGDIAVKIG